MKLQRIIIILTMCLFTQIGITEEKFDCNKYDNWIIKYDIFDAPIREENKSKFAEIIGKKKDELVNYGEKINELIINKKADELASNISTKEFKTYLPGKTSPNISESIRKELHEKKGRFYYFLFDIMKIYTKEDKFNQYYGEDLDVRQYLICFKSKLRWRVFYSSELNCYIAKFSIPDGFIERFGYFSYAVREEDGRYVLVGF